MEKPKKAVRRGTEEYKILCAMLLQVWDESPITYKEAMIKNTGTKKKNEVDSAIGSARTL